MSAKRWTTFDAQPSVDGAVRVGVWDLVCIPGHDEKDGQSTDFNVETLSQMIDNFLDRNGDPIPLDANHLSNYAHITGQPAPALAFYGALAIVWGGKVVRLEHGRDTPPCPGSLYVSPSTASEVGIDIARDGLWCFRNEVTEIGQQLLKGFKLVSPTFMSEGTRRDGTPVGYCLAAVAATNTPHQSGTALTFDAVPPVLMRIEQRGEKWVVLPENGDKVLGTHDTKADAEKQLAAIEASKATHKQDSAGASPAPTTKESSMAKAKFAKFAGAADGADDAAIKSALSAKTAELAKAAMSDEAFKYEEAAKELEEMAAEAAGEAAFEGEAAEMSKMAKQFRRFAKFDAAADEKKKFEAEEKEKMAKLESEKAAGDKAAMAVMQASLAATNARLAKFEQAEAKRAEAEKKETEAKFSRLADLAIAGGYDKSQRDNLITFARSNYDAAHAAVAHLLPKGAPSHLFDRVTAQGGPVGSKDAREFSAPEKPRVHKTPFGRFVEDDGKYAETVKALAESKDPATMAKIDKLLPEVQRPLMFNRLLAAQKIVRAEQPELAESAE